jgi:hypothetical protein
VESVSYHFGTAGVWLPLVILFDILAKVRLSNKLKQLMFKSFNPRFESSFSELYIVWIIFWLMVNGFQLLQFTSYYLTSDSPKFGLSPQLSTIVLTFMSLIIGIVLLLLTINYTIKINKSQKINSITAWLILAIAYSIIPSVSFFIGLFSFSESTQLNFTSLVIAIVGYVLLPLLFILSYIFVSVLFISLPILYFKDLNTYNLSLKASTKSP